MESLDIDGVRAFGTLVEAAVADGQVPGLVAAMSSGEDSVVIAAGDSSAGVAPMARDSIFRISSLTKPMVAVAALSQVADGLVALDDPVDSWLPELAERRVLIGPDRPLDETVPAARAVLLRDLLTSTLGIGMHGAIFAAEQPWPIVAASDALGLRLFSPPTPDQTIDPDEWLAGLGELPLLASPGETWLYQTSSTVLGILVSRIDGGSLESSMRRRVFDPLRMDDTGFWTDDSRRLTVLYGRDHHHETGLAVLDAPGGSWSRPPVFEDGAAGLVSTADDVLTFGRMLRRGGGEVLPPQLVREVGRDQLTHSQRQPAWEGFSFLGDRGWGFGASVFDGRCQWEGGLGTVWSNIDNADLSVTVLSQRAWDADGPPPVIEDAISVAIDAATR